MVLFLSNLVDFLNRSKKVLALMNRPHYESKMLGFWVERNSHKTDIRKKDNWDYTNNIYKTVR